MYHVRHLLFFFRNLFQEKAKYFDIFVRSDISLLDVTSSNGGTTFHSGSNGERGEAS